MTLITWASLRRPSYKTTSFPGSLLFTPQEAREGRPWLGLVTCLPKSGRLQISGWSEGRLSVSLPILSVPGMGKHAESRVFQRSCQVAQKHLKRYKARESVNVGSCRFCKSVGDTGNLGEIFTTKQESTTSGGDRGAFIRPRTSTM